MTQSLFSISEDMHALDALLEDADFDDPAVQEALAVWGDEIQNNMAEKVDNYAAFIGTLAARSEARKAEAQRLSKRATSDANKAKRLKEHLKEVLEFRQIKSLDTARYKVSVAKAGGAAPVEINVQPEDLPADLRTETHAVTANKKEIAARLKAGQEIPGCRLLERSTYLKIS